MAPRYISSHGTNIHQCTWHQDTSVHMAPRYISTHGTKIHQYTWHQDTQELRSIIDYIIARQNSGLKFQDVRAFRGMTVGSDYYLVNAKIFFLYGKNNANESRKNIIDCAVELIQSPVYNIDSLRDESTSFLYKKRLDEKLGEGNFESTEDCYQHLVKCIHQAVKEALGEKILRSKIKPFYYWNEETGQLVKEKKERKILETD